MRMVGGAPGWLYDDVKLGGEMTSDVGLGWRDGEYIGQHVGCQTHV